MYKRLVAEDWEETKKKHQPGYFPKSWDSPTINLDDFSDSGSESSVEADAEICASCGSKLLKD
jgi:hypothetical protein